MALLPSLELTDPLFELEKKGNKMLVKSVRCSQRSHVRFFNKTRRPCDIIWRDYQGVRRYFITLKPDEYYDVDTFESHPWHFEDPKTKENFVVDNKVIFRAPKSPEHQGMKCRIHWNITIPVRTLYWSALLTIAESIKNVEDVKQLRLPHSLLHELEELVKKLTGIRTIDSSQ